MSGRRTFVVACLAGHGIGPEVTAAASRALAQVSRQHGFRVEEVHPPFDGEAVMQSGHPLPAATRRGGALRRCGARRRRDRPGARGRQGGARPRGSCHAGDRGRRLGDGHVLAARRQLARLGARPGVCGGEGRRAAESRRSGSTASWRDRVDAPCRASRRRRRDPSHAGGHPAGACRGRITAERPRGRGAGGGRRRAGAVARAPAPSRGDGLPVAGRSGPVRADARRSARHRRARRGEPERDAPRRGAPARRRARPAGSRRGARGEPGRGAPLQRDARRTWRRQGLRPPRANSWMRCSPCYRARAATPSSPWG